MDLALVPLTRGRKEYEAKQDKWCEQIISGQGLGLQRYERFAYCTDSERSGRRP